MKATNVMKTAVTASLIATAPLAAAQQQLSVATGGTGGTYYPLGVAWPR